MEEKETGQDVGEIRSHAPRYEVFEKHPGLKALAIVAIVLVSWWFLFSAFSIANGRFVSYKSLEGEWTDRADRSLFLEDGGARVFFPSYEGSMAVSYRDGVMDLSEGGSSFRFYALSDGLLWCVSERVSLSRVK